MTDLLSVTEAARRLGVSRRRVLKLIQESRLPATRIGRAWVLRTADLDALQLLPVGWPKGRKRKTK